MKSYKKILSIGILFTLVLTIIPGIAHTEADPFETDLIAGQHHDAGEVLVWNDGNTLFVKFVAAEGWEMKTTHLHVAEDEDDIPQKNGNPPPGKFDYKGEHDPPVTEITYEIEWDGDDDIVIAAHADMCQEIMKSGGLSDVEDNLPETVTVTAWHATTIGYLTGYFKVTISDGGDLNDDYDGWCIDLGSNMIDGHSFSADVYSSYKAIPLGTVEHPENLDLVNWILNQEYIGEDSDCDGAYTFGDIQRAIWTLIEKSQSTTYLGDWDQCRVDEILADADDKDGFIPGCDEYLVIILIPEDIEDGQICIIKIPIPCEFEEKCETAWGEGEDFSGKNWAMFFEYTMQ
jgi:hypothetical protein